MDLYFDNAATTPVDSQVADCMAELLASGDLFANPASDHAAGRRAARIIDEARARVAAAVGAAAEEVVWTSGATEANNLALRGVAAFHRRAGRACHIVSIATEHASVLDTLSALEQEGVAVTRLPVDDRGRVDTQALTRSLRPETRLVSVMLVNNETGVVQDLEAIVECLAGHDALLHVDAAQGVGKVSFDLSVLPVDMASLSAHKAHGPKGVGALFVRAGPGRRLEPLLRGGGQERGLRSGTLATHQVAGMGLAFELATGGGGEAERLAALTARLRSGLARQEGVFVVGEGAPRAPHILSVVLAGVHARALQAALPTLAASVGSACNASTGKSSHVLRAMGIPDALAQSVLRLSVGRFTTEPQVDMAVSLVGDALARLRAASPLWHDHLAGAVWSEVYSVTRMPGPA